ncbi:MAG: hypothetical protein SW833_24485 [Cyanobacteriota bacterium]|nr:hypothetical protein [Cyanobacteriota bacterium]
MGVSDVTIGKWIKKICEVGATLLEGDRITADGFTILNDYQQASNKAAYLENIPTAPTSQTGELVHVQTNPFGFTILTKASQRVEALRGELVALEDEADSDLQDFLSITAEIESEDELGKGIARVLDDERMLVESGRNKLKAQYERMKRDDYKFGVYRTKYTVNAQKPCWARFIS